MTNHIFQPCDDQAAPTPAVPQKLRRLREQIDRLREAASTQGTRLETLGRAQAKAAYEHWKNADKKKLAAKFACTLAVRIVLSSLPVPQQVFAALDVFDT
jgi:hypothetical protein